MLSDNGTFVRVVLHAVILVLPAADVTVPPETSAGHDGEHCAAVPTVPPGQYDPAGQVAPVEVLPAVQVTDDCVHVAVKVIVAPFSDVIFLISPPAATDVLDGVHVPPPDLVHVTVQPSKL